jgi:hypothetical protein
MTDTSATAKKEPKAKKKPKKSFFTDDAEDIPKPNQVVKMVKERELSQELQQQTDLEDMLRSRAPQAEAPAPAPAAAPKVDEFHESSAEYIDQDRLPGEAFTLTDNSRDKKWATLSFTVAPQFAHGFKIVAANWNKAHNELLHTCFQHWLNSYGKTPAEARRKHEKAYKAAKGS